MNVSLQEVTLNQMWTASEFSIQRTIDAINSLPAIAVMTHGVTKARRVYDQLSGEQQAQMTNFSTLAAAEDKIAQLY